MKSEVDPRGDLNVDQRKKDEMMRMDDSEKEGKEECGERCRKKRDAGEGKHGKDDRKDDGERDGDMDGDR